MLPLLLWTPLPLDATVMLAPRLLMLMAPLAPLLAWKVRLPEPLVRMFSNCRLPPACVPAVRETSPPLVFRLATVRFVPALKLSAPPDVRTVLDIWEKVIAPVVVEKAS